MSDQKSNRDYLSHLPSELLDDIFYHAYDPSRPLTVPLSKFLLPFQRRQLFRSIEVHSYKSLDTLCTLARSDSSVPSYIKVLVISIEFNKMTMWDAEEAEDPRFPSNATLERFLKHLSSVQTVKISGSTRVTLSFLSPIVTSSLTCLNSLNIMSTLHTLSDPFNPSNYAGLQSCTNLTGFNLSLYHDSQAVPSPTQPQLESISFGSQLLFVQLFGCFSTEANAESVRRLISAFGPFPIFSICDTTRSSSNLPHLLGALPSPDQLRILVLGIESRGVNTSIGSLSDQLKAFTSLVALTLLSDFTSLTPSLYSNLHALPIEILKFETTSRVTLSQLFALVSGPTKHDTLKIILLDQIKGKVGTRIEDVGEPYYNAEIEEWELYSDWILPLWTEDFSEEGLVEFIEVAKKGGITVKGSTVDAIGIKAKRGVEWDLLEMFVGERE